MTKNRKRERLDTLDDLAQVYEQYTPELKGYIRKRVDSSQEAEDILHDVFYKLAKMDLLENPIEYISAWLYQSATNRIIDRSRKKREQVLPDTDENSSDEYFLGTLSAFLSDDNNDPEIMFLNEIIIEEIDEALSELPPEQRDIFEQTEYDGLSYKEISKTTGTPVATLLSRKHYAVNHLRKRLLLLYLEVVEK